MDVWRAGLLVSDDLGATYPDCCPPPPPPLHCCCKPHNRHCCAACCTMHTVELCTQDNEHQVRCNYLPASAALRLTAKTNSGQITDTRLALVLWLSGCWLHSTPPQQLQTNWPEWGGWVVGPENFESIRKRFVQERRIHGRRMIQQFSTCCLINPCHKDDTQGSDKAVTEH